MNLSALTTSSILSTTLNKITLDILEYYIKNNTRYEVGKDNESYFNEY